MNDIFATLSPNQKEIVFNKEGLFVVRACPGSGKTYSVAARLAHKISTWSLDYQGIATISFTNAAWKEIERQIYSLHELDKPISFPHFLGTIDSFINRYIFLPFGHLVIGCKNRPILVGEPHGPWSGYNFSDAFFPNLSYDFKGNLYAINKTIMPKNWEKNSYILSSKKKFLKAGFASQSDANFFGMKILSQYPQIAKSIVNRFPLMMIDEAQDTSRIQMEIINLLIENGLKEIMLIGDPDQAIFEWNDAEPSLLLEKLSNWKQNSLELNENRRSSQKICDFTGRLSTLNEISKAIDSDVVDYEFAPTIRTYQIDKVGELIDEFILLCKSRNIEINKENVAVLFRSKSLLNLIYGCEFTLPTDQPWKPDNNCSRELAYGKYLFESGFPREGFKLIHDALIKTSIGSNYCSRREINELINEIGFIEYRKIIYDFAKKLPTTNTTIGEWINGANLVLKDSRFDCTLEIINSKGGKTFDQLFNVAIEAMIPHDYRIGTIHSAKGETFEAVLVILKTKGVGSLYKTLLKNNISLGESEELRIVYVGLTRPRKILVLAVPDEENQNAWESKLLKK